MHFGFRYAIAYLPYFLQSFWSLLSCFILLNYSQLHLLFLCRFLPVSLPRFEQLLVHTFCFLLLLQTVHCCYFAACFFFCLVTAFLDACFCSVQYLIFYTENQRVTLICTCSFSFFLNLLFAFLLNASLYASISYRATVDLP